MKINRWMYRLLIVLGLGISLAATSGCMLGQVVTLQGENWRGNVEYRMSRLNTDPLPCTGLQTNVVINHNIGWGGWKDAVVNAAGTGLKRHGCVWVATQDRTTAPFSLVLSSFQPGDMIVGTVELVENATGAVRASLNVQYAHNYGAYASYHSNIGAVSTTPRDQVVYNALDASINAAIDHLQDVGIYKINERLGKP